MSSPAESSGGDQQTQKHGQMPVDILFCPECSNMLYPKEDKAARKLMYQCRTCQHTQEATSNCVYRNILKSQAGDTAGVTQDVALDPTVRAAPSESESESAATSTGLPPPAVLAMCGCCGHVIMCSVCDARPAYFPQVSSENEKSPLSPGFPQLDQIGPMLPTSDVEGAWDQILDEISNLNIEPDMDMDMGMDIDMDDMEGWEAEMEEEHVYGPPNKPIFS